MVLRGSSTGVDGNERSLIKKERIGDGSGRKEYFGVSEVQNLDIRITLQATTPTSII